MICPVCKANNYDTATACAFCGTLFTAQPYDASIQTPAAQNNEGNLFDDDDKTTVIANSAQPAYDGAYQQPAYNTTAMPAYNEAYQQQPVYTPPVAPAYNGAYQQQPVSGYNMGQNPERPAVSLPINYSLAKYYFLGIITFGIYDIVCMCHLSRDVNTVCSKYDGKHTMHYALVCFVFSWLTFGILPIIWTFNVCRRMGNELVRRNIPGGIRGSSPLLCLIPIAGYFIFYGKLLGSMNSLNANYNING